MSLLSNSQWHEIFELDKQEAAPTLIDIVNGQGVYSTPFLDILKYKYPIICKSALYGRILAHDRSKTVINRRQEITKDLINQTVSVYNGRLLITILIKDYMVGYKIGEFIPTRIIVKNLHSREFTRSKQSLVLKSLVEKANLEKEKVRLAEEGRLRENQLALLLAEKELRKQERNERRKAVKQERLDYFYKRMHEIYGSRYEGAELIAKIEAEKEKNRLYLDANLKSLKQVRKEPQLKKDEEKIEKMAKERAALEFIKKW